MTTPLFSATNTSPELATAADVGRSNPLCTVSRRKPSTIPVSVCTASVGLLSLDGRAQHALDRTEGPGHDVVSAAPQPRLEAPRRRGVLVDLDSVDEEAHLVHLTGGACRELMRLAGPCDVHGDAGWHEHVGGVLGEHTERGQVDSELLAQDLGRAHQRRSSETLPSPSGRDATSRHDPPGSSACSHASRPGVLGDAVITTPT